MNINLNNTVSITEANQNFSHVTRLVDENGAAIIMKNDKPKYVVLEFEKFQEESDADTAEVMAIGRKLLHKHYAAFCELAK